MRKLSLVLIAITIVAAAGDTVSIAQERGRMMPLPQLKCDRNDLTLYDGQVLAYRRRKGSTFLRIRTNFETTENVVIRHPGTSDPSKFFLINGEKFTNDAWKRIERRRYLLRPGMRANAWVCRGNPATQPVIDWQPDDTGANPRSR